MPSPASGPDLSARLLHLWRRLRPLPGGRWLYARLLGRIVPYSGTIGARVDELAPGRAVVSLRDRRRVRNHLGSIHAVALANLGELASGLAVVTALPPGVKSIVTALETRYHRKARGTLVARCEVALDPVLGETERQVRATIHDHEGELVAETLATWRLRPETP
ncbi:DUF4442 domain-containing protein [Gaopeijia maritima]|uniref:DUF4442 domain-containing protein n=1 Tax=Gaopeijia maritima TaxID=3119007 RepID=UPI00328A499D